MVKHILAKQIILTDEVVENAYLTIDGGKFTGVSVDKPVSGEIIDYSHAIIAPGLVDTHIHGYQGFDVMDNSLEGLKVMSEGLLSCGVTSWLPTTLTASTEALDAVCQTIGEHYQEVTGAKIRGIFLEGPFFTEKYKGAQNPKYMGDPSVEKLDKWHELSNRLVNKIAIAPERAGVSSFIRSASEKGIRTALAHSDASFEEAEAAVDAGANIFIHTFNGMSGLHHRNPGMVGAALALDNVYAEVICDGYHVHPAAVKVVKKARGAAEMVLVTDCMRAGGLGDGQSTLGEFDVIVKDGQARLADSGNLAGSVLELKDSVKNVVEWGVASREEAIRMASLAPAKSVGIDHLCGQIAPGFDADFIVLNDELELLATYLDGEKRYQA